MQTLIAPSVKFAFVGIYLYIFSARQLYLIDFKFFEVGIKLIYIRYMVNRN